jgi:hypothetical protein
LGAPDDLRRAIAFLRDVDARASERVEQLQYGRAFLHSRLPYVYDRNFVAIAGRPSSDELPAILGETERVLGAARLQHRKIVFDEPEAGEQLASLLAAMTWAIRRLDVMVFRAEQPPAISGEAREVEHEELVSARRESLRGEPWVTSGDIADQMVENSRVISRAVRERCFASFERGKVASWCRMFSDGRTAQIEDVSTVHRFQGRGHSRAAVTLALSEAVRGHDFVFLTADDEDWPKAWYERLGFDVEGVQWEALRGPSWA